MKEHFSNTANMNGFQSEHLNALSGSKYNIPDYKSLKTVDELDNMTSKLLDSPSSIQPDKTNPFVHRLELSTYDKIKVALMTIFILPIRIVVMAALLLFIWCSVWLGLLGLNEEDLKQKPITGWRRDILRPPLAAIMRFMFACGGLTWSFKGKLSKQKEAPIIVVGPHSSLVDGVCVLLMGCFSPVAKAASEHIFLFGTLLNFIQPVYVKRHDPNSRQNTVQEMTRRAHSKDPWTQIIIFPEGTCTNRSCLITFKPGAFIPGVPVQPVLLRYRNKLDTVTWTWDGPSALSLLWLTMCQFQTHMEIEYLPVYVPSEEEKNDPKLYANNVRQVMAKALGIPVSSYSYDDLKYLSTGDEQQPVTLAVIKLQKMRNRHGIKLETLDDDILNIKAAIKSREDHEINFSDFAKLIGIPPSDVVKDFFDTLDLDGKGKVDLKCYLSCLWLLHPDAPNKTDEAYEALSCDEALSLQEFVMATWLLLELPKSAAMSLFEKLSKNAKRKAYLEDFKEFVMQVPQWSRIYQCNGIVHPEKPVENVSALNKPKDD